MPSIFFKDTYGVEEEILVIWDSFDLLIVDIKKVHQ